MPLYEYRCRPCARTFELLRPMSSSAEPVACPAGHPRAERVISLFAARVSQGQDLDERPSGGGCSSCAGGACASCAR